jgi:hypothetical protein
LEIGAKTYLIQLIFLDPPNLLGPHSSFGLFGMNKFPNFLCMVSVKENVKRAGYKQFTVYVFFIGDILDRSKLIQLVTSDLLDNRGPISGVQSAGDRRG